MARGVAFQERYGVGLDMSNGQVYLAGEIVRGSTPGCEEMKSYEAVRLQYVIATRIVQLVRGGRTIDVWKLPESYDIAGMCFGVELTDGNSVRITSRHQQTPAGVCGACSAYRICVC